MSEPNPKVYACDQVREVKRLYGDLFTGDFRKLPIREQLDEQAKRLVEAHKQGDVAVVTHIKCWHPEMIGHSDDEIMNWACTLEDARETIAREYGFHDWSDASVRGVSPPDQQFESAVDAILSGDVEALRRLVEKCPDLVHQRSDYGHRSTLLHYVGSNGVETHRQVVPLNLAEVAAILLDAGADVNATAEMYGGGSTTIALFITSSHPAEAGVVDDVVKVLVDAGAETD